MILNAEQELILGEDAFLILQGVVLENSLVGTNL